MVTMQEQINLWLLHGSVVGATCSSALTLAQTKPFVLTVDYRHTNLQVDLAVKCREYMQP